MKIVLNGGEVVVVTLH